MTERLKQIITGAIALTLSLSGGDSFSKGSASRTGEDIYGGVYITVMNSTTVATSPAPYSKSCDTFRPPLGQAATRGTGLGGVFFVNFFERSAERNRFQAELFLEGRPSSIVDGFGKGGFGEAGWRHVAYGDPVEILYKAGREFMGKVAAAVGDFDLDGLRQSFLVGALGLAKPFLVFAVELRRVYFLASGQGREVFQAEVNPDGSADRARGLGRDFNQYIDIPTTFRVLREGAAVLYFAVGKRAGEEETELFSVESNGIAVDAKIPALKWNPSQIFPATPSKKRFLALDAAFEIALTYLVDGFGANAKFAACSSGKLYQVESGRPPAAKPEASFLSFVAVVPDEVDGAGLFVEGRS